MKLEHSQTSNERKGKTPIAQASEANKRVRGSMTTVREIRVAIRVTGLNRSLGNVWPQY